MLHFCKADPVYQNKKKDIKLIKMVSTNLNINPIENLLLKKYVQEWKTILKSRKFVETIKKDES